MSKPYFATSMSVILRYVTVQIEFKYWVGQIEGLGITQREDLVNYIQTAAAYLLLFCAQKIFFRKVNFAKYAKPAPKNQQNWN